MGSHNNAVVISCGVCHGRITIVVGDAFDKVPPFLVCVTVEEGDTPIHYVKVPRVRAQLDGNVVYVNWEYEPLWVDTDNPPGDVAVAQRAMMVA